jgi:ATP-binding protein involved in chromosome partitioning
VAADPNGQLVSGVVGCADLRGQLPPVLASDVLGHSGDAVGRHTADDPDQQVDELVVAPGREVEVDPLLGHLVALGGSSRPRAAPSVPAPVGHLDVPLVGELVEMVASDVRVDAEDLGDATAGQGLGRLADGDVDGSPGRISERRREIPDRAVEPPGLERDRLIRRNGLAHARNYSSGDLLNTIRVGEIGWDFMADTTAIEEAVAAVHDPLLHRSLGELDMVGDVSVRRLGTDSVRIVVPVPNYPLLDELEERVREAVGPQKVDVEFDVMSDEARTRMMADLRTGPGVGEAGSTTRTIAVASGKGGVGVIDADIWGFSIPRMLGVDHPPVVIEESIIPPEVHGVKAMSMDYFVGDDRAVIWRGPMLHKAIEQFLKDVWWDGPDFLLVDMPPGTGDVSISLSQFLPRAQVLLVTTPQPTAQRVARRAALMAAQVEQEVMGVVENMSWFTGDDGVRYVLFGEGGGAALADELDVPLMAQIPLLPAMREGADEGRPVVLAAPDSEVEAAFASLADAVIARRPRVRTHPELVIR